jgi:hypothetical protein
MMLRTASFFFLGTRVVSSRDWLSDDDSDNGITLFLGAVARGSPRATALSSDDGDDSMG